MTRRPGVEVWAIGFDRFLVSASNDGLLPIVLAFGDGRIKVEPTERTTVWPDGVEVVGATAGELAAAASEFELLTQATVVAFDDESMVAFGEFSKALDTRSDIGDALEELGWVEDEDREFIGLSGDADLDVVVEILKRNGFHGVNQGDPRRLGSRQVWIGFPSVDLIDET